MCDSHSGRLTKKGIGFAELFSGVGVAHSQVKKRPPSPGGRQDDNMCMIDCCWKKLLLARFVHACKEQREAHPLGTVCGLAAGGS